MDRSYTAEVTPANAEQLRFPGYAAIFFASLVAWAVMNLLVSLSFSISSGLLQGQKVRWDLVLSWDSEDAFAWALCTTLAFAASRRVPLQRTRWWRPLLFHIPMGIVVAGIGSLLTNVLNLAVPWGRGGGDVPLYVVFTAVFVGNIPRYYMILAVCEAVHYYQKYRDRELRFSHLETQLARAQLQALKMQLEPHFLFNVLNSIGALTRKEPAAAEKMTGQLAELLRLTLETVDVQEVPLQRELEFLECYLRIQQTRFEDRLAIRFDISPEVTSAVVPHLILQPLVENAVRHGIGPGTGTIEVRACPDRGRIVLEVLDDGRGLRSRGATEGLGMKNTRARLSELYGHDYEFSCENRTPKGCRVRIAIPFRAVVESARVRRDASMLDDRLRSTEEPTSSAS